jgi:hypothetical protein
MSESEAYQDRFSQLLDTWGETAELQRLEEAVALADTHGDVARGVEARLALVRAASDAGQYDLSLVTFVWCLGACENDPRLLDRFEGDLLWNFNSAAHGAAKFPTISLGEIDHTYSEMGRYYDRAGFSHRKLHEMRATTACFIGDIPQIVFHQQAWLALPHDQMSSCSACEAFSQTFQNLNARQVYRALQTAAPLMEGRYKCNQQPAACDMVLLPHLFRVGRFDDAERLQRRSYKEARRVDLLEESGFMLAYLGATDQLTRGVNLLEADLNNYLRVRRGWDRLHMLAGARVLLRRLAQVGRKQIKLRVRPEFEWHRSDNRYAVEPLLAWVEGQFEDLAGQFDRRNGNTVIGDGLRGLADLLEAAHPIDRGTGQA